MKFSLLNYLFVAVIAFSACKRTTKGSGNKECSSSLETMKMIETIKKGLSLKDGVKVNSVINLDSKCSIIGLNLHPDKIDVEGLNYLFNNTASFKDLKVLKISSFHNQLTTLRTEVSNLTNLTSLELSENNLATLPSEIGNLPNLTSLVLNKNNLLTSLPATICNSNSITTTIDGKNDPLPMCSLCSSALQNLKTELSLKDGVEVDKVIKVDKKCLIIELNLHPSKINVKGLNYLIDAISSFSDLTSLTISSFDQLTTLTVKISSLRNNLKILNLSSNKLSSLPIEIGFLNNLKTLDLSGNQLNILPTQIGDLANLESLNLTDNQLNNLPTQIGNLGNLEFLGLDNNKLTIVPVEIGNLSKLNLLRMENNQLTSLPNEMGNLGSSSKTRYTYIWLLRSPTLKILPKTICDKIKTGEYRVLAEHPLLESCFPLSTK